MGEFQFPWGHRPVPCFDIKFEEEVCEGLCKAREAMLLELLSFAVWWAGGCMASLVP